MTGQSISGNGRRAWHAAYGSNTHLPELAGRIGGTPAILHVGNGFLRDCELVFDRHSAGRQGGVLGIRYRPGALTPVALLDLSEDQWKKLDLKEGANKHYTRIHWPALIRQDGQFHFHEILVETYVSTEPVDYVKPADDYLAIVTSGYQALKLPSADLAAAAENRERGFNSMNHNIFTYGSLCRGESRAGHMEGDHLSQVGIADVPGAKLYTEDGLDYPGLLWADAGQKGQTVTGDLWSYERSSQLPNLFVKLDQIEGEDAVTIAELVDVAQKAWGDARRAGERSGALQSFYAADVGSRATRDLIEMRRSRSLYRRTMADIKFGNKLRLGWVYIYTGDSSNLVRIASGNWREFRGQWRQCLTAIVTDRVERAGGLDKLKSKQFSGASGSAWDRCHSISDLVDLMEKQQITERDLIVC